jgi:hypothetical protein
MVIWPVMMKTTSKNVSLMVVIAVMKLQTLPIVLPVNAFNDV